MILEIRDIGKNFGGLRAVDGVDLEVAEGEIVGVIGPNGAGKTTLLNCISGILRSDRGTIWFDGRRIDRLGAYRVSRLGISRTLQLAEHFKDFRIEDFVLLGRQHWTSKSVWACGFGFPAVIRREREQVRFVADLLDRFGLSEYRGERLRELPYGTQRLVDLARAMATQPRLLLLDEPTSGSSESEREALHRHVRELRSAGVTALVVDHDVGFVSQCSDRLLAMALGRALAVGTAEQVLADAEVISSYLGRPQESLAEGGSPDRSDDSDLSPK